LCLGVEICRFLTSIGGGLFSIGLDLHSSGDLAVSFSAGKISDVEEGVVESGEEMHNTEVVDFGLGSGLGWPEVGLLIFSHFFDFLGRLYGI